MSEVTKVATVAEIPPGGRKSIIVDELPALLLRAGDDFYCIEDVCTHDGQPLTDGPFEDCVITCPRHGARFDVKTGAPLCMPATEPVRVYPVEIRGEDVYVTVD
ncbi:MAG: non-heme iron oxygenase ferredoxin subunit [Planctomycetota bacterium]|nr:MAG: non-heme iron oxygenase ferredoxin subunit [Planctomycetota bacterium]REJ91563.1 MAG: non-heme iron oxygenase ferredoxin subunit [Planctomycetota bacterium]REK20504.1 MAG: non-heme iron oxygenase ferredoxin subunit [Planctomycetota bacterium]REK28258.1 MAG: non-heme iron oxygenase ferredoxin subunit [Planctomycetota bacterium]